MEDDTNLFYIGRQPECFDKLKTTSIFWQMEDDINLKLEDEFILVFHWKMTSNLMKGKLPQFLNR